MKRYYAGIGSRDIDIGTTLEFIKIGRHLAQAGYILRSGGARGSDSAFEAGCDDGSGSKEIFLIAPPNKDPRRKTTDSFILPDFIPADVEKIAKELYPRWNIVNTYVRRLHARNVYQILGHDLKTPSNFVVCYTTRSYDDPSTVGGTMFGIQLAIKHGIPVYNFYIPDQRDAFYTKFKEIL